MTTQERWDIVLKALNGPLSSMGEQVFRGPVVRIGANPGPGGFALNGYRGLDARQCVITAYTGGTASVAPVGTNQVRLAPHPNVNWKEIDPLTGPEYLSKGCALHLGPIGRGATIEFVECRRLGVWQRGDLASDLADVQGPVAPGSAGPGMAGMPGRPVAAYDARRVGKVRTSSAPFWFLGCMTLMSSLTASSILLIGLFAWFNRTVIEIGPEEEGYEFYEWADVTNVDTKLFEGMQRPFYDFVMAPNIQAAGQAHRDLDKPANWDQILLTYVTASVDQHVRAWRVFRRLDAIKTEYAQVVTQMRAAGLPEVFAAIPYQESRYQPKLTSRVCAHGFWQFMPEVALRAERVGGLDFKVRDCRIRGSTAKWSPRLLAPAPTRRSDYVDPGDPANPNDDSCLIEACDVDDRENIEKSTRAAIYTLGEAWRDPTIQSSGSAVQMTILTHNAGLDDSKWGQGKRSNVLPAYKQWVKTNGAAMGPQFYGSQIRCRTHDDPSWCGSLFAAETQHYGYTIIAQHFLAVCYYAKNYGEDTAFRPWVSHVTTKEGYCRQFKIPTKEEVRKGVLK